MTFPRFIIRYLFITVIIFVQNSILLDFDWQNGTGGGFKWAMNCDFYGSDITTVLTNWKNECGGKCYDNSECTHFSWTSGTCLLKHFESQPTASNLSSLVCGWISDGGFQPQLIGNLVKPNFKWQDDIGGVKWAPSCQFSSSKESNIKTISCSVDSCAYSCITLNYCTHFNWDSGHCFLKHLDPSTPANNFDGSICGWVNHSETRKEAPDTEPQHYGSKIFLSPYVKKPGNSVNEGKLINQNWNCCKPSCSWTNSGLLRPVKTCAKNGFTAIDDKDAADGCDGGPSYACITQVPWAVNDSLSYGFVSFRQQKDVTVNRCCTCYLLKFTSDPLVGKTMIVQVTNLDDFLGDGDFGLQIPGGRFKGCSSQWGELENGWSDDQRVFTRVGECDKLPRPLQDGCRWRFDWFNNAENPAIKYQQVTCPMEHYQRTLCTIS